MKKWLLALSIIIIIGGAVYLVSNYNINNNSNKETITSNQNTNNTNNTNNNSPHFNVNTPKTKAIDFKLKDLNGKEVSLSDFKGKKVYLNFFATWCPPCKAEMPEIQKLYDETKDSDLVILAVDLGEDNETVNSFINNKKYTFNVLLDSNNVVAQKYQITSIPVSYFIDKDGNIVDKHLGGMTIEDMKNYINKLN